MSDRGTKSDITHTIARFDFGGTFMHRTEGYVPCNRVYQSPRFLWVDQVREVWRGDNPDHTLEDFVGSSRGEFRMGLPAGEYELTCVYFDPDVDHGPFSVAFLSVDPRSAPREGNATVCDSKVRVQRGEKVVRRYKVRHEGQALSLRFSADTADADFIINTLTVCGPPSAELQVMYPDAPPDILPSIQEVERDGSRDAKAMLRKIADWLINNRADDGFVGDTDFSLRLWYTAAYPVRTWLAAYELAGDAKYAEASFTLMDTLIKEQMPEGSFTQAFRGTPTSKLTEDQLEAVRRANWMNLADVGSIVLALILSAYYAQADRKQRYLQAAERYAVDWALRFRKSDGSFTNGWVGDRYAEWSYGVSTANSAAVFALLGALTGNAEHMKVAEQAAGFLLEGWSDDGRPFIWPFDGYFPRAPYHRPVTEFGDLMYIHEGIIAVAGQSRNLAFRRRVFEAYNRYIFGSEGLLAKLDEKAWWPIVDSWNNSKSAAVPLILSMWRRLAGSGDIVPAGERDQSRIDTVTTVLERCRRFLSTPKYAAMLGVMIEEPQLPWGNNICSWSGCAVAASGFAGIALADMVKPGLSFLSHAGARVWQENSGR